MKSAPAKSARASRVSKAAKSAAPRHLITDSELRELVQTLETTVECNLIGGITANTPRGALKAWKAHRAKWVDDCMDQSGMALTREEAEDRFKQTDDCANMLRRVLPIFAAA